MKRVCTEMFVADFIDFEQQGANDIEDAENLYWECKKKISLQKTVLNSAIAWVCDVSFSPEDQDKPNLDDAFLVLHASLRELEYYKQYLAQNALRDVHMIGSYESFCVIQVQHSSFDREIQFQMPTKRNLSQHTVTYFKNFSDGTGHHNVWWVCNSIRYDMRFLSNVLASFLGRSNSNRNAQAHISSNDASVGVVLSKLIDIACFTIS